MPKSNGLIIVEPMIKKAFHQNITQYGVFSKTSDPQMIEIIGKSGFDFVILDLEHGPNSVKDLIPLIMACRISNLSPVIRVGELSQIGIQRVMDLGIDGIQIPQVQNRSDLDLVQNFTRFAPEGQRGVCRFVRAAEYSIMSEKDYYGNQNNVLRIVHLEGREAYENLDIFLTHPAVDVLFIGPYDLSHSLGCPGEILSEKVQNAINNIVQCCRERNKVTGIFVENPESALYYKNLGVRYIAYSVDVNIFLQACIGAIQRINDNTQPGK